MRGLPGGAGFGAGICNCGGFLEICISFGKTPFKEEKFTEKT
jgi:hypothetical protein